jgi:hypothetical protein
VRTGRKVGKREEEGKIRISAKPILYYTFLWRVKGCGRIVHKEGIENRHCPNENYIVPFNIYFFENRKLC